MKEKKITSHTISYCLILVFASMLPSCSSKTKQDHIISVQKRRILNLRKQVQRQGKVLEKLKTSKWGRADRSVVRAHSYRRDIKKLSKLVKKSQWVTALKLSGKMKEKYPKSTSVRRQRAKIFSRMGLKKQARGELKSLRTLQARKTKRKQKRQL